MTTTTTTTTTMELKRRFQSHLPQYGTLWRSMVSKSSLLTAIETKTTVQIGCPFPSCANCSSTGGNNDQQEATGIPNDKDDDSSSDSSIVRFDLSHLQALEEESVVKEHPDFQPSNKDDESFEHVNLSDAHDTDNDNQSEEDDSSGGSTVVRFDLSHLEPPVESDNENVAVLPPTLPVVVDLTDTPSPPKLKSKTTSRVYDFNSKKRNVCGYDSQDSWLVDDDEYNDDFIETDCEEDEPDCEQPLVRPTAKIDIHSDDNRSNENSSDDAEWIDDDEASLADDENPPSRSTIVILSSDSEDDHDDDDQQQDNVWEPRDAPLPRHNNKQSNNRHAFRRNRDALTKSTFDEFNRRVFDGALQHVTVHWTNKLKTTAGRTILKRYKHNYEACIELSIKVLDEPTRLRNTLLHEMCHAAQWLIHHNAKPAHGPVFTQWAQRAMQRIPDAMVTTTHHYEIHYKYSWQCTTPNCGVIIQRHSNSVHTDKHKCGKCKGRLVKLDNNNKPLSAYNLFVKQQSAQVRSQLGDKVTQSQVLQECARLWRLRKTNTVQQDAQNS
jgi:predicted SprT family Zn-dependent metalloprotease